MLNPLVFLQSCICVLEQFQAILFFKSRASCAHVKHILPKHTMKSLSGMGEEPCCVCSRWEQVLYPILKPGSRNYTTVSSQFSFVVEGMGEEGCSVVSGRTSPGNTPHEAGSRRHCGGASPITSRKGLRQWTAKKGWTGPMVSCQRADFGRGRGV